MRKVFAAAVTLAAIAALLSGVGATGDALLDGLERKVAAVGAKVDEVKEHIEAGLAAKFGGTSTGNPPLMFVPGLFGTYLTVTITAAGCDAMPECVRARRAEPLFVARVIKGPVEINRFLGRPWVGVPWRVEFLVALLTQTYNQAANTLNYAPGVTVGTKGTPDQAYCNGMSDTYLNGIVDKYLVAQVGYEIGPTLGCTPYNWELDMPGLDQAGYFDRLEAGVARLYNDRANDPPMPWMPRKKVVVMGHSMGTLFSTAAMLARPGLQSMVETVILLSPVSAGAALTWELSLEGGYEPALSLNTLLPPDVPPEFQDVAKDLLRYFLWRLAQIGAVNPTLAPYDLPPYTFKALTPPVWPNGFLPDQSVGVAFDREGVLPPVNVTVAGQLDALRGRLFRSVDNTSPLAYIEAIWPRSHSYNDTVVAWSSGSAPANVSIFCGYGDAVTSILTTAMRAPVPFPKDRAEGFATIQQDLGRTVTGPGDGVVNLQGSNGCDRMADNTGGQVVTSTSPDCEHVKIVENGPGAQALLNQLLTAAGINVNPPREGGGK